MISWKSHEKIELILKNVNTSFWNSSNTCGTSYDIKVEVRDSLRVII